MKRLFTLFSLLAVSLTGFGQSQNTLPEVLQALGKTSYSLTPHPATDLSEAVDYRDEETKVLDSILYFSPAGGEFVLNGKESWWYDEQAREVRYEQTEESPSGGLEVTQIDSTVYAPDSIIIYQTTFDPVSGVSEMRRVIETYLTGTDDPNEYIVQLFDDISMTYQNESYIYLLYGPDGFPSEQIEQEWVIEGGEGFWQNGSRTLYTWLSEDKPTEIIIQEWDTDNNIWLNVQRVSWEYDAMERESMLFVDEWDGEGWSNFVQFTNVYEGDNTIASEEEITVDIFGFGEYVLFQRTVRVVVDDLAQSDTTSVADFYTLQLDYSEANSYEYDMDNDLLVQETHTYDITTEMWSFDERDEYYYSVVDVVNVEELLPLSLECRYANPTAPGAPIACAGNERLTLRWLDLAGRILREQTVAPGDTFYVPAGMGSGMRFLQLQNEGGQQQTIRLMVR